MARKNNESNNSSNQNKSEFYIFLSFMKTNWKCDNKRNEKETRIHLVRGTDENEKGHVED